MFDVRFFKEADFDIDHCSVVARCREIQVLIKHKAQKSDVERFNLRKVSETGFSKQYQIKISNRFAASQDLNDSDEIYRIFGKH